MKGFNAVFFNFFKYAPYTDAVFATLSAHSSKLAAAGVTGGFLTYFSSVFFAFLALGSFFSTMALRWGRYTWNPMRPSGCLVAV